MQKPDNRPTYQIAAQQIADYVQPLSTGAVALPFEVRDEYGRMLKLDEDHLSGKHLVLIFLNSGEQQTNINVLKAFADKQDVFNKTDTAILAVSASSYASQNAQLKQQANFIWPITGDPSGVAFASYGLHKNHQQAHRVVLLTPLRQVRAWFDAPSNINDSLEVIIEMIKNHPTAEDNRWATPFAPVLQVPNVLSPEECARVIQSFEANSPFFVRPPHPNEVKGSFKVPVYEHDRQDRIDHIIKDRNLLEMLDERIWGRVTPMIAKAFAFNVTRREELHIARYTGERGGVHMGHRDNTAPVGAHRRFAFSLSLNTDYEGGELFFKEFSQNGYRAAAGSVLVFSSSLLHEVAEITQGIRYNLVTNLFNDETFAKARG